MTFSNGRMRARVGGGARPDPERPYTARELAEFNDGPRLDTRTDADLGNAVKLSRGQSKTSVIAASQVVRASESISCFMDLNYQGAPADSNDTNIICEVGWGVGQARQSMECDWHRGSSFIVPVSGLTIDARYEVDQNFPTAGADVIVSVACSFIPHQQPTFANNITRSRYYTLRPGTPVSLPVPKFARDFTIIAADLGLGPYTPNDLTAVFSRNGVRVRGLYPAIPALPVSAPVPWDSATLELTAATTGYTFLVQYGLGF